jgi:hypothetical protein
MLVRRLTLRVAGTVNDRWAEAGPQMEEAIDQRGIWPAAVDALTHEHDIRAELGPPLRVRPLP